MLRATILWTVVRCTRYAWATIAVAMLLGLVSGVYAARHFAINTDINTLISPDLTWRQREIAFEKAFPQHLRSILVVVEAPTAELTSQATAALFQRLEGDKDHFIQVTQPGGGEFFRKNGLLFLPVEETEKVAGQLTSARPPRNAAQRPTATMASMWSSPVSGCIRPAPSPSASCPAWPAWARAAPAVMRTVAAAAKAIG